MNSALGGQFVGLSRRVQCQLRKFFLQELIVFPAFPGRGASAAGEVAKVKPTAAEAGSEQPPRIISVIPHSWALFWTHVIIIIHSLGRNSSSKLLLLRNLVTALPTGTSGMT